MAWAALLPFSAAARMLVSDVPVEHCHRLNVESVIDTDPMAPEGPSQPRKASCPFCALAMATPAPATAMPLPCFVPLDAGILPAPFAAETPFGIEVDLPLSRAPPAAGCA